MRLSDFDVLTFDVIGTLIDMETGVLNWARPRILAVNREIRDQDIAESYANSQAVVRKADPKLTFTQRQPKIWENMAKTFGVTIGPDDGALFLASARAWPAFPDSVAALAQLKATYRHLIAVTNGDRVSARCMARTLGSPFFAIITEEDMGASKPDPKAYEYFLGHIAKLGVPKERVIHVAQSQYHDMVPAKKIGLASAWIYRRHGKQGYGATQAPQEPVRPDFLATSLDGFVRLVEDDLRAR